MAHQGIGLIVLVLLNFATLGNSKYKVGQECCFEDWENEVGKVMEAFQKHSGNFSAPGFLKEVERWNASFQEYYYYENPEGICRGQPNMKCNKATKICECNDVTPFKYVKNGYGFCAGGSGDFCMSSFNKVVGCKNKYFKCVPNSAWENGRFERKFN
jgi:hypothetical protein